MRKIISAAFLLATLIAAATCGLRATSNSYMQMPDYRMFFLENATSHDRLTKMPYITLHTDGAVELAQAPISSFLLPSGVANLLQNGQHLMHINSALNEEQTLAVFEFEDSGDTLVLREALVPLFAEIGARYVYQPQCVHLSSSQKDFF